MQCTVEFIQVQSEFFCFLWNVPSELKSTTLEICDGISIYVTFKFLWTRQQHSFIIAHILPCTCTCSRMQKIAKFALFQRPRIHNIMCMCVILYVFECFDS